MGYVERNLMNGETVQYQAQMHWLRYFWSGFWGFIGLMALLGDGGGGAVMILIVSAVLGVLAFLDVKTSEFVVTSRRIFMKQGLISRRSAELLLTKIEGVQVDQGILGRILDYGTIVPGGTGGTKQGFRLIKQPLIFRNKINEQIEERHSVAMGTPAPGPAAVPAQ